jgi:hypothetical protein
MSKEGGTIKVRKPTVDLRAPFYTYELCWLDSEHHKISLNGDKIEFHLLSDPIYLDIKIEEIIGVLLHEGLRDNLVYDDMSTLVTVTIGRNGGEGGMDVSKGTKENRQIFNTADRMVSVYYCGNTAYVSAIVDDGAGMEGLNGLNERGLKRRLFRVIEMTSAADLLKHQYDIDRDHRKKVRDRYMYMN